MSKLYYSLSPYYFLNLYRGSLWYEMSKIVCQSLLGFFRGTQNDGLYFFFAKKRFWCGISGYTPAITFPLLIILVFEICNYEPCPHLQAGDDCFVSFSFRFVFCV